MFNNLIIFKFCAIIMIMEEFPIRSPRIENVEFAFAIAHAATTLGTDPRRDRFIEACVDLAIDDDPTYQEARERAIGAWVLRSTGGTWWEDVAPVIKEAALAAENAVTKLKELETGRLVITKHDIWGYIINPRAPTGAWSASPGRNAPGTKQQQKGSVAWGWLVTHVVGEALNVSVVGRVGDDRVSSLTATREEIARILEYNVPYDNPPGLLKEYLNRLLGNPTHKGGRTRPRPRK